MPSRCLPPPSLPPGALWAGGITHLDHVASAQVSALQGASGPAHRPVPASLPGCLHLCRSLCTQRTIPSPGAPQAHHDSCLVSSTSSAGTLHSSQWPPPSAPLHPPLATHLPPEPCSLPSPGWTQALCSAPLHLVIRSIFFKIREMPETGSQC